MHSGEWPAEPERASLNFAAYSEGRTSLTPQEPDTHLSSPIGRFRGNKISKTERLWEEQSSDPPNNSEVGNPAHSPLAGSDRAAA